MQHDANMDQQMLLLRLQGPVAQLLANYKDPFSNSPDAKRRRMETKGVLQSVEEFRNREEAILDLEKMSKESCVPVLFGVPEADAGMTIPFYNRPRGGRVSEDQPSETFKSQSPYPSILRVVAEGGQPPTNIDDEEDELDDARLAALILSSTNPMFSLQPDCNPLQEPFLQEVFPGTSTVPAATFRMVSDVADAMLTETVRQVLKHNRLMSRKMATAGDVREAFRQMDREARLSGGPRGGLRL